MALKIGSDAQNNLGIRAVNTLGELIDINEPLLIEGDLVIDRHITNRSSLYVCGSLIIDGGELINLGDIIFLEGKSKTYTIDRATSGDSAFTGIVIDTDIECGDMFLSVKGPVGNSVDWSTSFSYLPGDRNSPFFFIDSCDKIVRKKSLQKGDKLYWNETESGIKLYPSWVIVIYFS